MKLSELQNKDVIDVSLGTKIGTIMDILIDQNGKLKSFLIEKNKAFSFFSKGEEIEIKWEQIHKIGEDVILVHLNL